MYGCTVPYIFRSVLKVTLVDRLLELVEFYMQVTRTYIITYYKLGLLTSMSWIPDPLLYAVDFLKNSLFVKLDF